MDAKHIGYQADLPAPGFHHPRLGNFFYTIEQVSPLERVYTQTSDVRTNQWSVPVDRRHSVSAWTSTSHSYLHGGYKNYYRQDSDSQTKNKQKSDVLIGKQVVSDFATASSKKCTDGQKISSQNASLTKFAANGEVGDVTSHKRKRSADKDDISIKRRRHDSRSATRKDNKDGKHRSKSSKRIPKDAKFQNATLTKFAENGKVKLSSHKRKREADEDDVSFKRRRHDRNSSNRKHKKDERRRSKSSKRSHKDGVRRRSRIFSKSG